MPEIDVPPGRLGEVLRQRFAADAQKLREAALEAALRGVPAAVAATDDEGLVDAGVFKNSWKAEANSDGAELRNDAPYAPAIEHGRRPGRPGPPYGPILEWVRSKLVLNGVVAPEEAESVAYAIRLSIHRKGTRPRLILSGLVPKLERYFAQEARRRLARS